MSALQTAPAPASLPALPVKKHALSQLAERLNCEPDRLKSILKATVLKVKDREATDEEVAAFIMVANRYELDPLTREIHAFVSKGGAIVPIMGIDGWVRLVNREPRFDGVEFEEQLDDKGGPLATTCTMYVKGLAKPVRVTEWFAECRRSTEPWGGMPRRMLRHKAYIQCGRIAFGFGGLYDEDEAKDIIDQDGRPVGPPPVGRVRVADVPPAKAITKAPEDPPPSAPGGDAPEGAGKPEPPPEDLDQQDRQDLAQKYRDRLERSSTSMDLFALASEAEGDQEALGAEYQPIADAIAAKRTAVQEAPRGRQRTKV